jgi:hypothetical protein
MLSHRDSLRQAQPGRSGVHHTGGRLREAAAVLGLDYSRARFGSVDEIYKSELGRDILAEATLIFANADEYETVIA